MNIIIAPDSFKECLSAQKVAENIAIGIKKTLPQSQIAIMPMADGGEGTVEALIVATQGTKKTVQVHNPLMRKIDSFFGLSKKGETAFIEMAAASGLELLSENEKNPSVTTTYGTGELINAALNLGVKNIIIGIGGSATNDGGAGMFQALGGKLLDKNGDSIKYGGTHLSKIETIDISNLDKRIKETNIKIACDVSNPLTGINGAVNVYSKQKGATAKMRVELEKNMLHFEKKLKKFCGIDIGNIPGAGAAGGLAAGFIGFLDAEIENGFQLISKTCKLEEQIKNCDLVITGEGNIDFQTQYGKTPFGVAMLAKKHNKPVIAIAGRLGEKYQELYSKGFNAIFSIQEEPCTLEESIRNTPKLLQNTAQRIIQTITIGKKLQ
ncbi:MAG: glycerate kinase [Bacteroidota bacterium]|nr:glycerate kinase [Bacteroidota bacterium]